MIVETCIILCLANQLILLELLLEQMHPSIKALAFREIYFETAMLLHKCILNATAEKIINRQLCSVKRK